jgi:hypothetical protein
MATMNNDQTPSATTNKTGAAAFPQTPTAFPNGSIPAAANTNAWSVKRLLDEVSGPKPAY